ncbi:MAG: hypothetical protein ACKV2Q_06545 [Planctomycetaceae bacterium]
MNRCRRLILLRTSAAILIGGACCLLPQRSLMSDDQPAPTSQKPQTFQETLAARPAPDLTTLVRRSSPTTRGDDASESFLDLLKLRETPNASAVPLLEKILVENRPTTRIHGFAAAQALFAIGTPEAHQILARNDLSTRLAVDYTSHWEMREPLRSRYIERHLLNNVAKDLVVELEQTPAIPQSGGRLNLDIIFRNVSDTAFFIHNHDFPGDMLHLRDATGQFMPRIHGRTMCKEQSKNIELKPGQTHRLHVTIDVAATDTQKRQPRTTGTLTADVRESGHYFSVNAPGKFEVLALFEAVPLTDEQRTFLKVDQNWKWWTGRAVSKPLSIQIALPASTASEKSSSDSAME